MHTVYLLLGSNQGDRRRFLQTARQLLEQQAGNVVRQSAFYESEPWGFDAPDRFINQALEVTTVLPPFQLLAVIQSIEKTMGRERPESGGYASRTIDIDILFYDDLVLTAPGLLIPHPRLHERAFVLYPLCEIASDRNHPVAQKTIAVLLSQCGDSSDVRKLQERI